MKRVFAFIVVFCIWVSGCTAAKPAQPVTHSFYCTLTVTGDGQPFTGDLAVTADALTWRLASPETVAGCVLVCDGEYVTVTPPDGSPLKVEAGKLPTDGAVAVLWNVLRTADPTTIGWQNGDGALTGRVTGGQYLLLTDAVSGLPKSLRLTDGNWVAVFSAFENLS